MCPSLRKQHFNSFKQEHRPKGYASVQHHDGAFEKFKKNVASINEHNEAYKNGYLVCQS